MDTQKRKGYMEVEGRARVTSSSSRKRDLQAYMVEEVIREEEQEESQSNGAESLRIVSV